MKEYRVFPANNRGICLRGFCPTVCNTEQEANEQAMWLAAMMEKYDFSYDHIVIEEE